MAIEPVISKLIGSFGFQVVNKKLFRKQYFESVSYTLMGPILEEYTKYLELYPTDADRRKGQENKILFVEMVHWLGLEKSSPLKILDIGGRGGLFAYFCKQYGHDSYVSDVPGVLQKSPNKELLELQEVKSIDLMIQPYIPVDTNGNRFDLITGFRTRFHSKLPFETGKDYEEHWGVREWDFFLKDLATNVLNKHGRIFFMLNRLQEREKGAYVPAKLAKYFRSKGGKLQQQFLFFSRVPGPF